MSTPDPLDELVAGLTSGEARDLASRLGPVLETQRVRIEYAESRRASLGVVAGVILGAGLAGMVQLSEGSFSYVPGQIAMFVLFGGLALTGAIVLSLYGRHTNWNYPFKAVSETWKWFYRDAIPQDERLEPTWSTRQSKQFKDISRDAYTRGRAEFAERIGGLTEEATDLRQDLEQVYLLHWNEFYKNQFLTRLRTTLIRGIELSVAAGVLALVISAIAC